MLDEVDECDGMGLLEGLKGIIPVLMILGNLFW